MPPDVVAVAPRITGCIVHVAVALSVHVQVDRVDRNIVH